MNEIYEEWLELKERVEKKMASGWFLSSTPWPGCPVRFNLVVMAETMEKAVEAFKAHFNKDDLEVQTVAPVEVVFEDDRRPVS